MQRVIFGFIAAIIVILLVLPGGIVTWAAVLAISLLAMYEFYKLFGVEKGAIGIIGYLSAIAYMILLYFDKLDSLITRGWIAATVVSFLLLGVVRYGKVTAEQLFSGIFGIFYIPFLLGHAYSLREMECGLPVLVFSVLPACFTDIFAFRIGSKFGKHKLCPKLSPKKSVEGAVGGVVGGVFVSVLFIAIVNLLPSIRGTFHFGPVILAAFLGSIISEFGDLAASSFKRIKGVKDYGKLLPGHGGAMDRIDSALLTIPVVYYVFIIFGY